MDRRPRRNSSVPPDEPARPGAYCSYADAQPVCVAEASGGVACSDARECAGLCLDGVCRDAARICRIVE